VSWAKEERTINLVPWFEMANGDDRLIELKMGMILRRKNLRTSRRSTVELPMVEIGFPVIGMQRGLATRLWFEEGPQHEICSREFEERHHTKGAAVRLGGRK